MVGVAAQVDGLSVAHRDDPRAAVGAVERAGAELVSLSTSVVQQMDGLNYIAVDDCGRILNPMLVSGQQHGGVAQGAAQALFDFEAMKNELDAFETRHGYRPISVCDNTLLGPIFQKPAEHGVDHHGYRHNSDAHDELEQDAGGEPVRVCRRSGEVVVTADDGLL